MIGSVLHLINQTPQLPYEQQDDYLARTILATDGVSDEKWATLPAKVRDWLNLAIKRIDGGSFDGLLEEPG